MKSRFHHKWRNLEVVHLLERDKSELVRPIVSMMEIVQRTSSAATMDVHMCAKTQVRYEITTCSWQEEIRHSHKRHKVIYS